MLDINWYIEFNTNGAKYQLALMAEVDILKSVDNLVDTAIITLPETIMNQPLNLSDTIGRGTEVLIRLGYGDDNELEDEFKGFVREVTVNNGSLKIECEDALFLFRSGVKDVELKPTSTEKIAAYVVAEINTAYKVYCTYNINYEKFTIHQATGYDTLKKIQEETKADVFFDTKTKVLHIHEPFVNKTGEVIYSMQDNVENSALEFKKNIDNKVEVTVESTDLKGNVQSVTVGTTGGSKTTIKVGAISKASIQKIADVALQAAIAPKYEGTIDTWLMPYVAPGYSALIKDEDYPSKDAWYYISSVNTNLSPSGGKRIVKPTRKLS